jgi:glycosyltransferase involved in cell wall biosynthesis
MISINGRFLTQKVSGVQRYAREIVSALDKLLVNGEIPLTNAKWRLVAPPGTECNLPLRRIEFQVIGSGNGHLWEQLHLRKAPGLIINLGNSGPILRRNSMVVIHDVGVFRTPENFDARYARIHRTLGRMLALTSTIGTVSEFSRSELSQVFKIPTERIFVAPNGADHLKDTQADPTILERLKLEAEHYFLFVGSPTRNKNLPLALKAFELLNDPTAKLVVVGSLSNTVFRVGADLDRPGVVLPGYLTDAEVSALYQNATALVFPSLYEGFGIPPLEAMVRGCPVLASNIPTAIEVCGDAAAYFGPNDATRLSELMRQRLSDPAGRSTINAIGARRAEQWTWEKSAKRLSKAIEGMSIEARV